MQSYRLKLKPLTAFGTPLVGDTLFGQLCWTLRHLHSEARLIELLQSYTNAQPFMVISDAFPAGYLPLPSLPSRYWNTETPNGQEGNHKALKKKHWLPLTKLAQPVTDWQIHAISDTEIVSDTLQVDGSHKATGMLKQRVQPHNTINRQTGTTGTGQFAPHSANQIWHHPGLELELYLLLDENRLKPADLKQALQIIGDTGYGRDASTGLGKFDLVSLQPHLWDTPASISHLLTLSACAPQGLGFDQHHSYYQVQTRFGRHGDAAALGPNPFKQPLLMARRAAVFAYSSAHQPTTLPAFIGQGVAHVSRSQPAAVHQGYAPVLGIFLEHAA